MSIISDESLQYLLGKELHFVESGEVKLCMSKQLNLMNLTSYLGKEAQIYYI